MLSIDLLNILLAIIFLGLLAIFSYKKRMVTKSGLVAAFFLGLGVWLLATWAWFFILLMFFLITAQFTHYKYQQKRTHDAAQEKGGARSWSNVLANGLLPLSFVIIATIFIVFGGGLDAYGRTNVGFGPMYVPAFPIIGVTFAAFLGALATATADTLATEIGLLNPTAPRLITKPWKRVPPGTSGGVSLLGELATLLGCLVIGGTAAIIAAPFWFQIFGTTLMPELVNFAPITMIIIALVGGLVGCTVDSLFGATIQGMWVCSICRKKTEKKVHCSEPAEYLRGNRFFDNNLVNLISGLIGALTAMMLYLALLSMGIA